MSYFIKFWEDSIYHPLWRNDPIAWKLFEYLLISSYTGSPQGTTVKTLQQITEVCGGKNSTNYKAITRLKKHGMVKTESNYKRTKFKIVNWWKYQGTEASGKNSVKTESKLSNTLNKNKDIRIKNKEPEFETNFKQGKINGHIKASLKGQVEKILKLYNDHKGGWFNNSLHTEAIAGLIEKHGFDVVYEKTEYALTLDKKDYKPWFDKPVDLADHFEWLLNPVLHGDEAGREDMIKQCLEGGFTIKALNATLVRGEYEPLSDEEIKKYESDLVQKAS